MAKTNDLKRWFVIYELSQLRDVNNCEFFLPQDLTDFRIEFGEANKKTGIGRVKVSAKTYYGASYYTYIFYGEYSHLTDHVVFKSVQIDKEFSCSLLCSITQDDNDTFKISRSWLSEEEGEGEGDAPAGVCLAEVVADADSDSYTKYCAVNSSLL